MRRVPWLVPLGVLGLLAALIAWHGTIPYPDARYDFADHERYLALAQQPFGSRDPLAQEAPFRWRLVVPLVVWALHATLGLPLTTGFWLLTLLALGLGDPRYGALVIGGHWLGKSLSVWVAPLVLRDPNDGGELLGVWGTETPRYRRLQALGLAATAIVLVAWLAALAGGG